MSAHPVSLPTSAVAYRDRFGGWAYVVHFRDGYEARGVLDATERSVPDALRRWIDLHGGPPDTRVVADGDAWVWCGGERA